MCDYVHVRLCTCVFVCVSTSVRAVLKGLLQCVYTVCECFVFARPSSLWYAAEQVLLCLRGKRRREEVNEWSSSSSSSSCFITPSLASLTLLSGCHLKDCAGSSIPHPWRVLTWKFVFWISHQPRLNITEWCQSTCSHFRLILALMCSLPETQSWVLSPFPFSLRLCFLSLSNVVYLQLKSTGPVDCYSSAELQAAQIKACRSLCPFLLSVHKPSGLK